MSEHPRENRLRIRWSKTSLHQTQAKALTYHTMQVTSEYISSVEFNKSENSFD